MHILVVKVEKKKRVRWADTPAGQQSQQQQQQQGVSVPKPELSEVRLLTRYRVVFHLTMQEG